MIKRHLIVWKKKEFWPMILTVWHSIMHRKRKLLIKHKTLTRFDKYKEINVYNFSSRIKFLKIHIYTEYFCGKWNIWSKSRRYILISLPRIMRLCVWMIFVSCVLIFLSYVRSPACDMACIWFQFLSSKKLNLKFWRFFPLYCIIIKKKM